MSVLKVSEVQTEEGAKKDEAVAGQVRMCEGSDLDYRTVVLVVDVTGSFADKDWNGGFLTVVLDSENTHSVNKVGEFIEPQTGREIADSFPILLDAELTYKEVE